MRSIEDFDEIWEGVEVHRKAKIAHMYAVRDAASPEARHRYGVEATEYRRISERLKYIPTEHVPRKEGQMPTDAGLVKPKKGDADMWIEYIPGFGGSGFNPETNTAVQRIVPAFDDKKGIPSRGFAQAMGWTGNGEDIDTWWARSFVEIDEGVWKYVGGSSPMPFYILSYMGALNNPIFRREQPGSGTSSIRRSLTTSRSRSFASSGSTPPVSSPPVRSGR